MITIELCTNTESVGYYKAMEIYNYSFPDNERRPEFIAKRYIIEEKTKLFIMKIKKEIIGLVFLSPIQNTDYWLFDYFAIAIEYRKKGYGDVFISYIINLAKQNGKKLILEAENPNYGDNTEERISRIMFYLKRGFKIIENCPYALPDFTGDGPVELTLMLYSLYDRSKINGQEIIDAIENIYINLYNRSLEDEILVNIKKNTLEVLTLSDKLNLRQLG